MKLLSTDPEKENLQQNEKKKNRKTQYINKQSRKSQNELFTLVHFDTNHIIYHFPILLLMSPPLPPPSPQSSSLLPDHLTKNFIDLFIYILVFWTVTERIC